MNKKIFGGIALLVIAAAVALNVTLSNQKQKAASLLALVNVEALAQSEGNETGYQSMLVTENGSDYECLNGHSYKVNKYNVSCWGKGTMSCTSGNYETWTPTGTLCGNA